MINIPISSDINDSNKEIQNLNINEITEKFEEEEREKQKVSEIIQTSIKNKEGITRELLDQAQKIGFKSISDSIVHTNTYGFIRQKSLKNSQASLDDSFDTYNDHSEPNANQKENPNSKKSDTHKIKKKDLKNYNNLIDEWEEIMSTYNSSLLKSSLYKYNLKIKTRKGIPDSIRGYVWQKFAEIDKYFLPGAYYSIVENTETDDKEIEHIILKDIDRTFPNHIQFKSTYGGGQRSLFRVLYAYSKFNLETGYVQGMGFITGLLLMYMDEESTFYFLQSLMKKYQMEGYYINGFPLLKKSFYVLLRLMKKLIPDIYELFRKNYICPSIYASGWFITLFSRDLDFPVLIRFFDCFLLEGIKVVYRFGLALLEINKKEILKKGPEGITGIMDVLKTILVHVDEETLFKTAFGYKFHRELIRKYENEYEKVKTSNNNEFMELI